MFIGFRMLHSALKQDEKLYNHERNHHAIGNQPPGERAQPIRSEGKIVRDDRLGGLLKYYYREAA